MIALGFIARVTIVARVGPAKSLPALAYCSRRGCWWRVRGGSLLAYGLLPANSLLALALLLSWEQIVDTCCHNVSRETLESATLGMFDLKPPWSNKIPAKRRENRAFPALTRILFHIPGKTGRSGGPERPVLNSDDSAGPTFGERTIAATHIKELTTKPGQVNWNQNLTYVSPPSIRHSGLLTLVNL